MSSESEKNVEAVSTASPTTAFKATAFFDAIEKEIRQRGADLVSSVNGVYCMRVQKGEEVGVWIVDVKNGKGSVTFDPLGKGDVTLTMTDDNWVKLLTGQLNPQEAYIRGQLKLSGNIGLAMKLQSFIKLIDLKSKL